MSIKSVSEVNPQLLSGHGRYVLEVRGESMIDIGICDGDFVVINHATDARNGEIVVALVKREEATLKRFYRHADGRIELRPENTNMQPEIYSADEVEVQGKMVGLFRSY